LISERYAYDEAVKRNLGLVSEGEQQRLRRLRVGLPGLGAVGGAHAQALARLGVSGFHLADLDDFEVVNIHRQVGATVETIGRPKVDVTAEVILSINPEALVECFPGGISPATIDAFLDGLDVVVAGIEFFKIEVRRMLFAAARDRGIPIVTAGPVGYGAGVLVFMPDGTSFDEHFRIDDTMTRAEQLLAFSLGIAPGLGGGIDPRRIDFEGEKGPALISACLLCGGTAATEVLKLVTGRGRPAVAPHGVYYDPFKGTTRALKPRPSLRSRRGRIVRRAAFKRLPALAAMHEAELTARNRSSERELASPLDARA
jgi:molybdopterin/thiamine biosynthesis adenylyltransferase